MMRAGEVAVQMRKNRPYHYAEAGLDNVYLVNGFQAVVTPRGQGTRIENLQGLHRAIARAVLDEKKRLSGKEVRFLRHELDMTQAALSALVGVDVQTVARWEKGHSEVPPPADRLIRAIYNEMAGGSVKIIEPLRRLSDLDEELGVDTHGSLYFEAVGNDWQLIEKTPAGVPKPTKARRVA
jgi:putative transcriptional regulator